MRVGVKCTDSGVGVTRVVFRLKEANFVLVFLDDLFFFLRLYLS